MSKVRWIAVYECSRCRVTAPPYGPRVHYLSDRLSTPTYPGAPSRVPDAYRHATPELRAEWHRMNDERE